MPSPADAPRRVLEWGLRAAALALLVVALVRLARPAAAPAGERARGAGVRAALVRWSAAPEVREVHVGLDAAPPDTVRDWLAALRGAGVRVRWSGTPAPLAVAVEPVADPAGGARVLVATARSVALRDAAGALDSVHPRTTGASLVASVTPPVSAALGADTARASQRDSLVLRPVLVLGTAGWEAKFVAAALEERGWRVVTRAAVAPRVTVEQGALGAIDTARYAAVVAVDAGAAPWAAAVAAYVRRGGGLVLAPAAARVPAFSALAPATAGTPSPGNAGVLASADPRRGLPFGALRRPRADAVTLETRGDEVAVAARRVGRGRVVQHGYEESWPWRMAGGDAAPAAHRRWWSGLVSAAAYTPTVPRTEPALDDAPLARLVSTLGPPVAMSRDAAAPARSGGAPWWLFAGAAVALLLEWASRRLRGAR